MTISEVKTALYEAKKEYRHYTMMRDIAEAYRYQATGLHSMSGDTHSASKKYDAAYIKLLDYDEKVDEAFQRWLTARENVEKLCLEVEDEQEQTVLIYYYLNLYTFEEIADRMNYSVRYVFKLYKNALKYLCGKSS